MQTNSKNENDHTPGPWHAHNGDVYDADDRMIAKVWGVCPERDANEVRGNLELISNALGLYDCVKQAIEAIEVMADLSDRGFDCRRQVYGYGRPSSGKSLA